MTDKFDPKLEREIGEKFKTVLADFIDDHPKETMSALVGCLGVVIALSSHELSSHEKYDAAVVEGVAKALRKVIAACRKELTDQKAMEGESISTSINCFL